MTTTTGLFRLATRLDEVGFSDIVRLRNRIMELRSKGATVHQFGGGEPYTSNGVSTPTQWAGLAAFDVSSDILESNRIAYQSRRDLLLTGLNELGLYCEPPAGAFYAFPNVARISHDSREAADILLERAQVATLPGVVFGPHGEGHLRFSFSTSIDAIEAGLDSLRRNL